MNKRSLLRLWSSFNFREKSLIFGPSGDGSKRESSRNPPTLKLVRCRTNSAKTKTTMTLKVEMMEPRILTSWSTVCWYLYVRSPEMVSSVRLTPGQALIGVYRFAKDKMHTTTGQDMVLCSFRLYHSYSWEANAQRSAYAWRMRSAWVDNEITSFRARVSKRWTFWETRGMSWFIQICPWC